MAVLGREQALEPEPPVTDKDVDDFVFWLECGQGWGDCIDVCDIVYSRENGTK